MKCSSYCIHGASQEARQTESYIEIWRGVIIVNPFSLTSNISWVLKLSMTEYHSISLWACMSCSLDFHGNRVQAATSNMFILQGFLLKHYGRKCSSKVSWCSIDAEWERASICRWNQLSDVGEVSLAWPHCVFLSYMEEKLPLHFLKFKHISWNAIY